MAKWISSVFLYASLPLLVWGQSMPLIHHYDAETIDSHPQHWSIAQDSSGYLYFGSQGEGTDQFDGVNWRWDRVPGTGAIRSLYSFNSNIHWGGVGDFGHFVSDSLHSFTLHSLKDQIDSTKHSFGDVWQMVEFQNRLYHRTSDAIYILEEDSIRVLESQDRLRGIFTVGNEIWVQRENSGIQRIESNRWEDIPGTEAFIEDRLVSILPYAGNQLLIFRNRGFVKYDGETFTDQPSEVDDYLREHSLYRATFVNENEIALAFLNGGILIVGADGSLKKTINEDTGLPTNVIYEIYVDREGTLWATSVDGMIKVLVNNPVSVIPEQNGFNGIVSFIESLGDTIYVGSQNGLFFFEPGNEIQKYPGIDQTVYDAINLNGSLFVSYPPGLLRLGDNELVNLYSDGNYSKLEPSAAFEDAFFGSQSHSIDKIVIQGDSAEIDEVLRSESSEFRDFYVDGDEIWAVTYQNEVIRKSLNSNTLETYIPDFENEELPIRHVALIDNKIRLGTDSGLFVYDPKSDSFQPDSSFNDPGLNSTQVFQFEQCSPDEIWFRNNFLTKRAVRKENSWEITEIPYRLIGADNSIENIHCNPDGTAWFGGEGLFHLSDPNWTYKHDFNTNITAVSMPNDSLVYGGYGELSETPVFSFENNELRFNYAAASYIEPEENTYRVRLKGYEEAWSDWSDETQKDYTFIPEGTYTFQVQGRNVYEQAGAIDSFTFTVLPPWYRTIWAYIGYLLITGGIIYGGYRIRLNTILREQRIRDGIARDLHDELSSTLSSINFFADAINSQKLDEKENNRFLSLITKSSREAKEKVSDIVWVIHSENDDWENLFLRCKRFAADMLDAQNIKYEFSVRDTLSGRPAITERKNIWLIFREILTNIARHSKADQVDICFRMKSGKLHIRIEDDGKGFEPSEIRSDGYGVQNIKERVEQLNGEYSLKTKTGKGTRWEIYIPIA
ncbi:MAG: triple tyrosine motif-containing protein [Balneolaceae bacterium]|nr:triple tyrosine motif-containing protein [Balneolaceae bacterium]